MADAANTDNCLDSAGLGPITCCNPQINRCVDLGLADGLGQVVVSLLAGLRATPRYLFFTNNPTTAYLSFTVGCGT
jgi:hypothetical protein